MRLAALSPTKCCSYEAARRVHVDCVGTLVESRARNVALKPSLKIRWQRSSRTLRCVVAGEQRSDGLRERYRGLCFCVAVLLKCRKADKNLLDSCKTHTDALKRFSFGRRHAGGRRLTAMNNGNVHPTTAIGRRALSRRPASRSV